jgi:hypothetical protein
LRGINFGCRRPERQHLVEFKTADIHRADFHVLHLRS